MLKKIIHRINPASTNNLIIILGMAIMTFFFVSTLMAQSTTLPSSHWGGTLYPNTEQAKEIGVQFILFSEHDKYKHSISNGKMICTDEIDFSKKYNHMNETLGFNLISMSNTRFIRKSDVLQSSLLYQGSLFFGLTHNQPTEFLQNRVIHTSNLRGADPLCKIPREKTPVYGLLGYSGQLSYFFNSLDRSRRGTVQNRTPFFVGGGYAVSNIMQDAYIFGGFRDMSSRELLWKRLRISISGVFRAGYPYKGFIFKNVANGYTIFQGSIKVVLFPYFFPIAIEIGRTAHSGLFLKEEFDDAIHNSLNDLTPLRESFSYIFINIGSFKFEMFNDSAGKKDRGPTFGTRISATLYPTDKYFNKLLNWFPLKYL